MVFKTIAENVQSFFQKEEDLEQEPKKVPDAAMELFEKPINKEHGIVAHHLPKEAPKVIPVRPKLPFSSEQLKEQLVQPARSQPVFSRPSPEQLSTTEEDISSAIAEFEEAIGKVPGEDGSTVSLSEPKLSEPQSSLPRGEGYFDQLAERLREQGYDESALQGALEAMKSHHEQRAVVAEQRSQNQAQERELTRKLTELQRLEYEWASKRDQTSAAQNRMAELEGAISAKTDELKELVSSMRNTPTLLAPEPPTTPNTFMPSTVAATYSQTIHPIPQPTYSVKVKAPPPFILLDGTEIVSLAQLRECLLNMSDATFYHHVTPNRNDFSTWIRDALGDLALADRVMHVSSKYELAKFLH